MKDDCVSPHQVLLTNGASELSSWMQLLTQKYECVHNFDTSYYESKGCTVYNRHLRRKTGSHRRRRRYRFATLKTDGVALSESKPKVWRSRRKPLLLQQHHSTWQSNTDSHWMKIHLWYTKRFYMLFLYLLIKIGVYPWVMPIVVLKELNALWKLMQP